MLEKGKHLDQKMAFHSQHPNCANKSEKLRSGEVHRYRIESFLQSGSYSAKWSDAVISSCSFASNWESIEPSAVMSWGNGGPSPMIVLLKWRIFSSFLMFPESSSPRSQFEWVYLKSWDDYPKIKDERMEGWKKSVVELCDLPVESIVVNHSIEIIP